MKHIQIDELHIIGFKGIKDLVLSFGGHSAVISGRNGTGKTSVYDAFLWLAVWQGERRKQGGCKALDRSWRPQKRRGL